MGIFNTRKPVAHFYILYNYYKRYEDEPYIKGMTIEVEYPDIKSDDQIINIAEQKIKNHIDTHRFDETELLFIDRLHRISTSYLRHSHIFTFLHPELREFLQKRKFK